MRLRHEPWGAWALLESRPALVALDHGAVKALGVPPPAHAIDDSVRPPLEAHVAVTERCGAGCEGCYVDARPDGREPALAEIARTLDELARAGVFVVAFGGGEPTTRGDIGALAREAKKRGLLPVLTTSGLGLRDEQVEELAELAAVNVSYDGAGDDYARVRGFRGATGAEAAIKKLVRAGVHVGVNVVLTRETFPRMRDTALRATELGAREIQLLRYKPSGRARSLDYLDKRLTPAQVDALGDEIGALVKALDGSARVRIDCALVPLLSTHAAFSDAATLARFGVFGCEGGEKLVAVKADGATAPCSFATSSGASTFESYASDPELSRWRAWNASPAAPCASCTLFSVCKGGCKVVSAFVDDAHGPDPECPRVRSHRGAS
jgi:radical SAM protein with 4Fe4S-binding SPASM domain